MPNAEGGGGRVEGCGGGRKRAADQYPHLKHLSVAHLKKIWTGFSKNLSEERLSLGYNPLEEPGSGW